MKKGLSATDPCPCGLGSVAHMGPCAFPPFKAQSSQPLDPQRGGAAGKRNNQATEATVDNPALPDGPIPVSGVPGRAYEMRLSEREYQEEERLP